MTPYEFQRLLAFQRAKRYAFRPSKQIVSRFSVKRQRPQGRQLVPLEQLFINHK
jgi:hypothetical protein